MSSSLGISSIGVKQIRYIKHLRSSSLGISSVGGKADWVFQVSKV